MELRELIELNEGPTLDFKKEEYKKESKQDLIKDIMAMANSLNNNVKRIIIGVKKTPINTEVLGLECVEDVASYENIIQENVEPNINFNYEAYNYSDDITLGVFEIYDNNDRPYMMKKDCGGLKKGDIWIRKGTRNSRATRADLDKMIKLREGFVSSEEVSIGFGKNLDNEITLKRSTLKKEDFPSEKEKERLTELLKKLNERYYDESGNPLDLVKGKTKNELFANTLFSGFDDSKRAIRADMNGLTVTYLNKDELLEEIDNVSSNYSDWDNYYIFEEHSERINFYIRNEGRGFLENVKIQIIFDTDGIMIADEIYDKPAGIFDTYRPTINNYPYVYYEANSIIVEEEYNYIRHKDVSELLEEDLRVVIPPNYEKETVEIRYIINAKNIPEPIKGNLRIVIQ